MTVEAVNSANDDKNYESNEQEINYVLNEIAVGDVGYGVSAKNIRNINGETSKIKAAGEQAANRHDNIID